MMPLSFLPGCYKVSFSSPSPEKILNFCHRRNLPISKIRRIGKDRIEFQIAIWHKENLLPFGEKCEASEELKIERKGFFSFLLRYRKRWGFFCGLFLFLFSILLSRSFLWMIEIEGNVTVPESKIRSTLAEIGISEGMRLSKINADEDALRFQVASPDFSFASINLVGTRAKVMVREREQVGEKQNFVGSYNLVAKISGKICRFEVISGQVAVQREEAVEKGKLLVSGIVETQHGAYRTVRAAGRVFAETEREFSVFVPFSYSDTRFTGKEREDSFYSLLGIPFRVSIPKKVEFESFETVREEEWLTAFGILLPIRHYKETNLEKKEILETVNVDRAENLAYDKYEEYKRDSIASGFEIIEEEIKILPTEEGVWLSANLKCIEDIAAEKPFSFISGTTSES